MCVGLCTQRAMIRLFFSLLLFSCLCTYPNLFSLIKADEDDTSTALTLCDAATQSGICANLNISYPFGAAASCAASDSFRVNCANSSQAYWDGFTSALDGDKANLGPPAVGGIFTSGYFTFINLTWNLVGITDGCPPLPVAVEDAYLPQVIDLNSFASSSFQLSSYNHILLLNCATLPPSALEENSTVCQAYQQHCGQSLLSGPCMQIPVPAKQLKLREAISNFSCTHFQFFVAAENSPFIPSWSPGLIQLVYTDVNCKACYVSNGRCLYDKMTHIYQGCACRNNKSSDTDCDHIPKCNGLWCEKSTKNAIIAAATTLLAAAIVGIVILKFDIFGCKTRLLRLEERLTRQKLVRSRSSIFSCDLDELTQNLIEFSCDSIVHATEGFRNRLGEGGFGAVYKGILYNARGNVQIAVKVLKERSKQSQKQTFLNEVKSIGRIHHINVVRLLGFCSEEGHEMLVYEYVVNGSLDKWVLHQSGSQNRVLRSALGGEVCHRKRDSTCRHRIVHCDIKPQNILLDEQMCPKIADFGLARLMSRDKSQVATMARGTPGYMGPELWLGGESQLSTKLDVYSYGMVLLELISGQQNFRHDVCFPEMAHDAAMRGMFESVLDVKLGIAKASNGECIIADGIQQQQVRTALLVALWCIQALPNRPSMKQVVQYLEGGAPIDEQPPRPAILSFIIADSVQQSISAARYDITPVNGGR